MSWVSTIRRQFPRTMGTGLLLLVPVMLTFLVLRLLFDAIDGILQPAVEAGFDRRIPGLGLVILVILIYVAGLLGAFFLGRRFIRLSQDALLRTPVIGGIYSTAKQLVDSFSGGAGTGFKRVVVIEYPRAGVWTIGFLTSMTEDENGNPMAMVYMPTAPLPNSGWVAFLPAQDVYDTNLSLSEAMQLVLSGGIVAPPQIKKSKMVL